MKLRVFRILVVFLLCFIFATSNLFVYADTLSSNVMSYSVLCDGGFGFGHAALMNNNNGFFNSTGGDNINPVIEVHQINNPIIYSTYNGFKGTNTFLGYYCPKTPMTSNQRTMVIAYANGLETLSSAGDIVYGLTGQLFYDNYHVKDFFGSSNQKVIEQMDITKLRCDGFVEYCYERNNIKISGSTNNWNIAIAEYANQFFHTSSLDIISPKIQAYTFMQSMVGDLNADGNVTTEDASIALRIAISIDTPAAYHIYVGDVNDDGSITTEDSRLILRYAVGLESVFMKDYNTQNFFPNDSHNLISVVFDYYNTIC